MIQLRDELARLPGVGDVRIFGAGDYTMRVWLDPAKVAARNLTAGDVVQAIGEQNVQVAAGKSASRRRAAGPFQLTMNTQGRLLDAEQFGDDHHEDGRDGRVVRLRDVARIELAAQDYDQDPASGRQARGRRSRSSSCPAPTRSTRRAGPREDGGADAELPRGPRLRIVYDTTLFVRESINEWSRRCSRPCCWSRSWSCSSSRLAGVDHSAGRRPGVAHRHLRRDARLRFSLNKLSLFGLVLAIGIVVDDAIVVVENVERQHRAGPAAARSGRPGDGRSHAAR